MDDPRRDYLVEQAVHWAAINGLTMLSKRDGKVDGIQHCPMALKPFVIPAAAYQDAVSYALPFNRLVDHVSRDTAFLYRALESVEGSDEFTAQLIRISKAVHAREGGLRQKVALGFNRSDYMFNDLAVAAEANAAAAAAAVAGGGGGEGGAWSREAATAKAKCAMQQVELNTISASFGVLSSRISQLHQFMQARFGQAAEFDLPANDVTSHLSAAIAAAHRTYCLKDSSASSGAAAAAAEPAAVDAFGSSGSVVVVFVVQEGETNIADQRPVEYALFNTYMIEVERLTLAQVYARTVRIACVCACGVYGGGGYFGIGSRSYGLQTGFLRGLRWGNLVFAASVGPDIASLLAQSLCRTHCRRCLGLQREGGEYALTLPRRFRNRCRRMQLLQRPPTDVCSCTRLWSRQALSDDGAGRLILDGGREVSVVYFRSGYSPNDYKSKVG